MTATKKNDCGECHARDVAGPDYNPLRRTGRTTRAVTAALMGALGGHRVLYVCANDAQAVELARIARALMLEAQVSPESTTAHRINMFNGGWLEFRRMQGDLEFKGIVQHKKPSIQTWDHYALELGEAERARKQKDADRALIHSLLKKHGYSEAIIDDRVVGGCKFIVNRS